MQWKYKLSLFSVFIFAFFLFLFPEESRLAVQDGLNICFELMIPSLFPFFVLSFLLVSLNFAEVIAPHLQNWMFPLFRLNGACITAILLGMIGGYPIGVATLSKLYEQGQCTREDAIRLSAFCNYCGPAFLFGITGIGIFSSKTIGFALVLIHLLSGLLVGLLFRFYPIPSPIINAKSTVSKKKTLFSVLPNSIKDAFNATLQVCAFVIFFSVFLRLLDCSKCSALLTNAIPFLSPALSQSFVSGLFELSSGIYRLTLLNHSALTLSLASFLLAWGGLSVHMQALPFLERCNISLMPYFLGKLLHAVLACSITFFLSPLLLPTTTSDSASAIFSAFAPNISIGFPFTLYLFFCITGIFILIYCKKKDSDV